MRWGEINRWGRAVSLTILVGLIPTAARACAVCWGGDDALARGLNASILFMISMPFLVGGSILGVIFVATQRARGQHWPYVTLKQIAWIRKEVKR